jgi:hypothetical protein
VSEQPSVAKEPCSHDTHNTHKLTYYHSLCCTYKCTKVVKMKNEKEVYVPVVDIKRKFGIATLKAAAVNKTETYMIKTVIYKIHFFPLIIKMLITL